ncbi:MAG TPA: polysaccharide biosynthesis/export family protein [Terriglobia bacterium]|nr:polysaccharide biosynthesis/export family protein [Terriglobia bacterium]
MQQQEHKTMRQILSALLVICIFSAGGMSQGTSKNLVSNADRQTKDRQLPEVEPPAAEDYIIGPEDVLSIFVWHEAELTNKVTVRPDGKIGIPLLNDIQANGLTTKQLQENITEGLKRFVTGPQVSVVVQEIHSQVIYITGSVIKPGVLPLGGPMTVMEALIRAGGIAEFAKSEEIQILRKAGSNTRRFRFNYKTFAEGKDYQQNVRLLNGDMVIVP